MNQPELGKKILEERNKLGLTQKELAENCNLSLRTIQRIESAEVTPRSYTTKIIFSNLNDLNNSPINFSNHRFEKNNEVKKWQKSFFKNFKELFNLKTNTIKKLSILSLLPILLTTVFFLSKNDVKAQNINDWFLTGNQANSYEVGLDKTIFKTGNSCAFLKSKKKKIKGFGTLMQTCNTNDYLGKRIKMSAYIKSENVSDWAGMWLRIDSKQSKKMLSLDNMYNRPIKGSNNWAKYEIILDVPEESGTLNYGVLLNGTGKVWFDGISFGVVNNLEIKPTNETFVNNGPLNLDFSE